MLNTPLQSSDLNPIENLWIEIGKKLNKFQTSSKRLLKEKKLQKYEIPSKSLVHGMERRLRQIINEILMLNKTAYIRIFF